MRSINKIFRPHYRCTDGMEAVRIWMSRRVSMFSRRSYRDFVEYEIPLYIILSRDAPLILFLRSEFLFGLSVGIYEDIHVDKN